MFYYAVEKHGIVRSWGECQPLIHGKNLKYKKFKSEADAQSFLDALATGDTPTRKRPPVDDIVFDAAKYAKTNAAVAVKQAAAIADAETRAEAEKARAFDLTLLDFYTDGSHIKGTTRMGFGIYCCYAGVKYGVYQDVTPEWVSGFVGADGAGVDWTKMSNPTVELLAVVALFRDLAEHCAEWGSRIGKVSVFHDMEGVAEWIEGRWRAKAPNIVPLVKDGRALHERIAKYVPVSFVWVPGHSGVAGNTYADMLSRGEHVSGLRSMHELFEVLKHS